MAIVTEHLSPSPHRSARKAPISCVVIHTTESDNAAGTLAWFQKPESRVSAHVVIAQDGSIHRCVSDDSAAWHAGASSLHGKSNVNHFSLGVEIVGRAEQTSFPPAQLHAAARWVGEKCREYGVPLNRVVGHVDIAPGRKTDPGEAWPWREFMLWVSEWANGKGEA